MLTHCPRAFTRKSSVGSSPNGLVGSEKSRWTGRGPESPTRTAGPSSIIRAGEKSWDLIANIATAHRRFAAWTKASLWRRLHRAALDELGARGELDWTQRSSTPRPRAKRGSLTGPGRSRQVGQQAAWLSEAQGIPLAVAISGANVHAGPFKPPLLGLSAICCRRGPRRRPVWGRADKAHFSAQHLAWVRSRGLIPCIARPGHRARRVHGDRVVHTSSLLHTADMAAPEMSRRVHLTPRRDNAMRTRSRYRMPDEHPYAT